MSGVSETPIGPRPLELVGGLQAPDSQQKIPASGHGWSSHLDPSGSRLRPIFNVVTASIIDMERKSGEVFERLFVELNINI